MKQFFWKIVLCVVPCALATWVTADAVLKYKAGEAGGFKLGVDLVGGTILVYEIDMRKQQEATKDTQEEFDVNVLATALKKRIDPNDLYNIVIRPAGGEGRVEIILPTGGTHRAKKAEEAWSALLEKMEKRYDLPPKSIEVGRGKVLELADRIQIIKSKTIWENKLFSKPAAWDRLKKSAYDRWAELEVVDKDTKQRHSNPKVEALDKVKENRLREFVNVAFAELAPTEAATSENSIESWVKQRAWEEMLELARDQWPELKEFKEDMDRIPPDSTEQLVSFIQAKGVVIGQAALATLEPLLGKDAYKVELKDAKGEAKLVSAKDITTFVDENYGPSVFAISDEIARETEGRSRDLSVEEVQRIKDLVAKVGSLEFRILANNVDDKDAEEDAKKLLASAEMIEDLDKRAKQGLPPPGPRSKDFWVVPLKNHKSKLTYSWVELGPQERKSLNLDNAAKNDSDRNYIWLQAQLAKNKATLLTDRTGRPLLQGALFFTRECKDQNLPEEDRRKKQFEYFVLTRDPEFDPDDPSGKRRVPKITGDYLIQANADRTGPTPAVHFVFNTAGGELFGDVTRKNVPSGAGAEENQVRRHLAIILDALVMSAPTINSEIRTHGQISGNFTGKEVDNLVNILRAGRLPATLKPQPVSESTIGATLGQDTIQSGVRALGFAFLAVLAFMVVYYRFAGFVASVALLANLVLTVGFMVAVNATFTLPGLAGLVLMLGMAVDANVLIYERFREERDKGTSLTLALRNAYDRSFPTIIDTHLSSMFTAIVLYIVGNDQLKGFGVSLTVGLLISLFTSLYMTRLLFDIWIANGWLTKLGMLRFFSKPDIDFMGARKFWFTTSVIAAVVGIVLFVGRVPYNLNIDFVGGTAYGGELTRAMTIGEVRKLLDEDNQKKALNVEVKEEPGSGGLSYLLTYTSPNGTKDSRTVNLANTPIPDPREADSGQLAAVVKEREAIIAKRASELPDVSVEQIFVAFRENEKADEGADRTASRYFTVRTSEKEPELVQAILDRLMRTDEGAPLIPKVYMDAEAFENKKGYKLKFAGDPEGKTPGAGSVSFVKSLFQRELMRAFGVKQRKDLPFEYDIVGEGRTTEDGKNRVMVLRFETELTAEQRARIDQVLQTTEREFAARPQPDRLENFDSQLATHTRLRAMWAILASWVAILMYVWFRFGNWTFGLAAVLCLVHDVFFSLGAITLCHYIYHYMPWLANALLIQDFKIDLTTVAALLTLVGYSINDKIVVYDRMREVRGKSPDLTPNMINDSINQSLSRTLLTGISVLLVLIVLYVFGGEGLHLFAFVMTVGMIVGTYSSIYVASPLLLIFGEGGHEGHSPRERAPEPEGAAV